jgi:hypothetical protein
VHGMNTCFGGVSDEIRDNIGAIHFGVVMYECVQFWIAPFLRVLAATIGAIHFGVSGCVLVRFWIAPFFT